MKALLALPASLLALGLVATGPASAASYDCNGAARPDEIAVCNDPALSDLDVEMATLYRVRLEIPMMMGARGAARDEQVAFLKERGACGSDIACLGTAYRQRIGALDAAISAAMQDYCAKMGLCG